MLRRAPSPWPPVGSGAPPVRARLAHEARRIPATVVEIDAADTVAYARVTDLLAALDAGGITTVGFTPRR